MTQPEQHTRRKRRLFRRTRRPRLRYISILPSSITLLNGVFGFVAIIFASKGGGQYTFHRLDFSSTFAFAGYLIFLAMIADMLDGRVARISHTTSSFGGQLDSLCDVISFGVAPAFLVLNVLEHMYADLLQPTQMFSGFVLRFVWLSGIVYMVCAAVRLARFNVENEEDETAHMSFIGLPSPAGAGVLASLVIFYEDLLRPLGADSVLYRAGEATLMYTLPFVAMGTGLLMISRVRYPHFVNKYFKGRKPVTYLLWVALIAAVIWLANIQIALMIAFCGFALVGFVRWLYVWVIRRGRKRQPQRQEEQVSGEAASQQE